ncbi:cytochrome c [Luteolibacter sp. LG18]|uniref:c-type cytochrome n=1 Tax=Luteolibacter sp. LG18 TaxID=2819286 RepID=UPI002B31BFAE|nr:hypothetical protein llg_21900 [Luteolibacter sp. LG18]
MKLLLPLLVAAASPLHADPFLTYENRPLGTADAPLLISTYLPDPSLDPAVFAHHHVGEAVRKYSPEKGVDLPGYESPIPGVPAALAVNFGKDLSYVFDTVECRPLYAWQGGFLDFTPYWGDVVRGSRVSFDYVPRLVGTVFQKASGGHPISIDDKAADADGPLQYVGYKLEKGVPRFTVKSGKHLLKVKITPGKEPLSCHYEWSSEPPAKLVYKEGDFTASGDGKVEFDYKGKSLADFNGYQVKLDLSKPNVKAGNALFGNYGCATCHSTDGAGGHGPTLAGLANSTVELEGGATAKADTEYLLEAIRNPNAKIVKGYPPNYMPPFAALPDVEVKSLVLYIQSLPKPE